MPPPDHERKNGLVLVTLAFARSFLGLLAIKSDFQLDSKNVTFLSLSVVLTN